MNAQGKSRAIVFTTAITAVAFLLLPEAGVCDPVQDADMFIQSARTSGQDYVQFKDKNAAKKSKEDLKKAEDIAEKALKKDSGCAACAEKLLEVQYLRAYFKFDGNYKKVSEEAEKARKRFPENPRLALLHGYALCNTEDYEPGIKALKEYFLFSTGNPEEEARARDALKNAQEKFLAGWYKQADWYNSPKSTFQAFDPASKQLQTLKITPEWEMNLGSQAFTQLTGQGQPLTDPEVQSYMERMVAKLAEKTQGPQQSYKVSVMASKEINAVTVPGHVVVYTGLIGFADQESQLVGVLAHELGHNYGHHAARRYIKAVMGQNIAAAVVSNIDPNSKAAPIAGIASMIGVDLFLRAYSRFEEEEADHYGAHLAFNAGYDPTALSSFFLKLYKEHPKQPPKFLSTHPPAPKRIEYMTDYMESFPLDREVKTDSDEYQRIRAKVAPQSGSPGGADGRGMLPPP